MIISGGKNWQGDDGMLRAELRELAQQRIAKFKQPKTYVFLEALPWNPSGRSRPGAVGRVVLLSPHSN